MNLNYKEEIPGMDEFYELFITTGWNETYRLTREELYEALENSWYIVSVYCEQDLVGFGRVIADGPCHALILDMIIRPDMQRKGIGTRVLDMIVAKCKAHKVRDIQLFSAKGKVDFYKANGFEVRSPDAPGMQMRVIPE